MAKHSSRSDKPVIERGSVESRSAELGVSATYEVRCTQRDAVVQRSKRLFQTLRYLARAPGTAD